MSNAPRQPFRWAILGTGGVARKFVLDLRQTGGRAVAQVVASRDVANARRFAADLGVARAVADYDAAIAADVDAVYVATPAALHETHALAAIAAGRPVLIEKPLASDAAAAARIAEAARAAGVFCMEALWTRFQPLPAAIRDRIAAGDLGEIRGLDACFSAANLPDASRCLFDPGQGGGALLHRGIYPLSLARFWLGPIVQSRPMLRRGLTGVDEDGVLLLRHKSGAISTIRCGLRSAGPEGAVIQGTRATLLVEGPIYRPTGALLVRTLPRPAATGQSGPRRLEGFRETAAGLALSRAVTRISARLGRGQDRIRAPFRGNGYHHQVEAVMRALAEGRTEAPEMPLAESLEIIQTIGAALAGDA